MGNGRDLLEKTLRERLASEFCAFFGHAHAGRPECMGTEWADRIIAIVKQDDEHRAWAADWLAQHPVTIADSFSQRQHDLWILRHGDTT